MMRQFQASWDTANCNNDGTCRSGEDSISCSGDCQQVGGWFLRGDAGLKMVPGEVVLHLTVAGSSGRVIRARTSEATGTATCIRRLARGLRFPRFSRRQITIRYTYDLR